MASCGAGGGTVAVGTAGPWKETYALNVRRAVELAVEDVNRNGTLGGIRMEVKAHDDEGDGVKAAAVALALREDAEVVAVVGHANSGGMVGAAPLYDGYLAAISPSATSPEISGISPWVFRVTTNDSVNGAMLARFAATRGFQRVAVLYENNVYGRDLANAFRAAYGRPLVGYDPIASDGSRVEPYVSHYARLAPDLIFVAGTEASGRALLREAARQGFRTQWAGGDGWTGIEGEGAADGAFVAVPFDVNDPDADAQRFVAAFRARYHADPDANAAMAYDATMLIAQAVKAVGPDRRKVRDYLAARRGAAAFQGVTGDIRFAPSGDPEGDRFAIMQVSGGRLRPAGEAQ